MSRTVFFNADLVLPDEVLDGEELVVEEGRISHVGRVRRRKTDERIDVEGNMVSPGLIDLHVHGALGRDTMEATPKAWETIARYHAKGGTAWMTPTTVAAPVEEIVRVLELPMQGPVKSARIAGFHVEGPFLSPEKRGAHDLRHLLDCTRGDFLEPYLNVIRQVTLAPELPGGEALISRLTAEGVMASAGHTNGTVADFKKARDAGLNHGTHCFNCMSTATKKGAFRQAGFVECLLGDPNCTVELIADGYHVSPELLRMAYAAKGPDGIVLISDATAGAGLKKGSKFTVGGHVKAVVHDGHALTEDGNALAGSTIRLIDSVRTMVQEVGVPLVEAIRMATLNPAKRIGMQGDIGSLAPGKIGDVVILDKKLRVRQRWMAPV